MFGNNKSRSINFDPYFILCIAFTIAGVCFPSWFMWVVWAFITVVMVMYKTNNPR